MIKLDRKCYLVLFLARDRMLIQVFIQRSNNRKTPTVDIKRAMEDQGVAGIYGLKMDIFFSLMAVYLACV